MYNILKINVHFVFQESRELTNFQVLSIKVEISPIFFLASLLF